MQDMCTMCNPEDTYHPLSCSSYLCQGWTPMQIVAVDIIGPFPQSESGNLYILVASDYFTRWVEAFPIPNQEARTVAKILVNDMFLDFPLQNSCTQTKAGSLNLNSLQKCASYSTSTRQEPLHIIHRSTVW